MSVMTETRIVTLAQVLDAIEKNGWEQSFGHFMEDENGREVHYPTPSNVKKACALGQGMLNLGTTRFSGGWDVKDVFEEIMFMNDKQHKSVQEIVDTIRKRWPSRMSAAVTLGGYGGESVPRP